ncbi:MAG: UvrD-helicase domain-containing protein, partial [Anaerovoracaceae bacterium]
MTYLDNLNKEQREAALHKDGPLLILAGAGSGKTSTMTHRIAHLIEEEGVDPYHILAVTFTNKAAGEMRERVESLLGGQVNMWIMTFHAACLRILRKYAEVLGYTNDFVVYDPVDTKAIIKNIIKEQQIDDKQFKPAYLLSVISSNKEAECSPDRYKAENGDDFRAEIIYKAYKEYERILKKNNAMDFDDLLLNTVKVFDRDEAALLHNKERFHYIMLDEYQDTNR